MSKTVAFVPIPSIRFANRLDSPEDVQQTPLRTFSPTFQPQDRCLRHCLRCSPRLQSKTRCLRPMPASMPSSAPGLRLRSMPCHACSDALPSGEIGARPRCGPPAQAGRRIPAERDVADRLILLAAALAVPTLQLLAGFLRPRVDRRQCSAPGCSDAEKQVF